MDSFSPEIVLWWVAMSILGVLNVGMWICFRKKLSLTKEHEKIDPLAQYRFTQWVLAGFYTVGCASRSIIIRSDVKRLSMFDAWITNVMVGRTIATIAEVCFVVQWALLLNLAAQKVSSTRVRFISLVLVPGILLAEVASWYSVLTKNRLGNIIEESIWAGSAVLFLIGLKLSLHGFGKTDQKVVKFGMAALVAYIVFMLTIDIPNYISLWQKAEQNNQEYLTISQGLQDIQTYIVTGDLNDWQYEIVWMSLYFSLAVWMSLAMIFWPKFDKNTS